MVCTAPSLCCPGFWGSLLTWGLGRAFLSSDVNPALSSFPESGHSAGPEPPAPAHPEAWRAGEAPRPLPGQGRLCPGQGAAATAEGNWGWASSRPGSGDVRKSVLGCAPVDARRVSWWPSELGAGGVAAVAPVPSLAWGLARAPPPPPRKIDTRNREPSGTLTTHRLPSRLQSRPGGKGSSPGLRLRSRLTASAACFPDVREERHTQTGLRAKEMKMICWKSPSFLHLQNQHDCSRPMSFQQLLDPLWFLNI